MEALQELILTYLAWLTDVLLSQGQDVSSLRLRVADDRVPRPLVTVRVDHPDLFAKILAEFRMSIRESF